MGTQSWLQGAEERQGREGFHKQRSKGYPGEGETGKEAAACPRVGIHQLDMPV